MKYFSSICVAVITVVLVLDLIKIHRGRKQVNEYKYKIYNWINITTTLAIILFLMSSVLSILSYFRSHRPIAMSNAYIFLIVAIQYSIHLFTSNYICDTGIWYWGQLYKWDSIASYTWSSKENYVVFKIKKKFFGIESELTFRIKELLREEVEAYLSSHLGNSELIS
jgi:hypothetical protein